MNEKEKKVKLKRNFKKERIPKERSGDSAHLMLRESSGSEMPPRSFQGLQRPIKITDHKPISGQSSLERIQEQNDSWEEGVQNRSREENKEFLEELFKSAEENSHFRKVLDILVKDKELEPLIFDHKQLLNTLRNIQTLNTEQMLSIISATEKEVFDSSKSGKNTYERETRMSPDLMQEIEEEEEDKEPFVDVNEIKELITFSPDLVAEKFSVLKRQKSLLTQKLQKELQIRKNLEELFEKERLTTGTPERVTKQDEIEEFQLLKIENDELRKTNTDLSNTIEQQIKYINEVQRLQEVILKEKKEKEEVKKDRDFMKESVNANKTVLDNLRDEIKLLEKDKENLTKKLTATITTLANSNMNSRLDSRIDTSANPTHLSSQGKPSSSKSGIGLGLPPTGLQSRTGLGGTALGALTDSKLDRFREQNEHHRNLNHSNKFSNLQNFDSSNIFASFDSPLRYNKDLANLLMDSEKQFESKRENEEEEKEKLSKINTNYTYSTEKKTEETPSTINLPKDLFLAHYEAPLDNTKRESGATSLLSQNILNEDTFRCKDLTPSELSQRNKDSDNKTTNKTKKLSTEDLEELNSGHNLNRLKTVIRELKEENELLNSKLKEATQKMNLMTYTHSQTQNPSSYKTQDASLLLPPSVLSTPSQSTPYITKEDAALFPSPLSHQYNPHVHTNTHTNQGINQSELPILSHDKYTPSQDTSSLPNTQTFKTSLLNNYQPFNQEEVAYGHGDNRGSAGMSLQNNEDNQDKERDRERESLFQRNQLIQLDSKIGRLEKIHDDRINEIGAMLINVSRGVGLREELFERRFRDGEGEDKMGIIKELLMTLRQSMAESRIPLRDRDSTNIGDSRLQKENISFSRDLNDSVNKLSFELERTKAENERLRREKVFDDQTKFQREIWFSQTSYNDKLKNEYEDLLTKFEHFSKENIELKMNLSYAETHSAGDSEKMRKYFLDSANEIRAHFQGQFFDYKLKVDGQLLNEKERNSKFKACYSTLSDRNDALKNKQIFQAERINELEQDNLKISKKVNLLSHKVLHENEEKKTIINDNVSLLQKWENANLKNKELNKRLDRAMNKLKRMSNKFESERKVNFSTNESILRSNRSFDSSSMGDYFDDYNRIKGRLRIPSEIFPQEKHQSSEKLEKYKNHRKYHKKAKKGTETFFELKEALSQSMNSEQKLHNQLENLKLSQIHASKSAHKAHFPDSHISPFKSESKPKQPLFKPTLAQTPAALFPPSLPSNSPPQHKHALKKPDTPHNLHFESRKEEETSKLHKLDSMLLTTLHRQKLSLALSFLKWQQITLHSQTQDRLIQEKLTLKNKLSSNNLQIKSLTKMQNSIQNKDAKIMRIREKNIALYHLLAKCIKSVNSQKAFRLNLSAHNLGDSIQIFMPAVQNNHFLVELNLASNRITDSALIPFTQFLGFEKLRILKLQNNLFGVNALKMLLAKIAQSGAVQVLDLSRNRLHDCLGVISQFLSNHRSLQDLRLNFIATSQNVAKSAELDEFVQMFKTIITLQRLELNGNSFLIQVGFLSEIISCKKLNHLKIDEIGFGSENIGELCMLLEKNQLLKVLHIAGNNYTSPDLIQLLDKISWHLMLGDLNLSNYQFTEEVCQKLSSLLKNESIYKLSLCKTGIKDEYLNILSDSLSKCQSLQYLNMDSNLFTDEAVINLCTKFGAQFEFDKMMASPINPLKKTPKESRFISLDSNETFTESEQNEEEKGIGFEKKRRKEGFIEISMQNNNLTDESASALTKLLPMNLRNLKHLKMLNLCGCNIQAKGISQFRKSLIERAKNPALSKLEILLEKPSDE